MAPIFYEGIVSLNVSIIQGGASGSGFPSLGSFKILVPSVQADLLESISILHSIHRFLGALFLAVRYRLSSSARAWSSTI